MFSWPDHRSFIDFHVLMARSQVIYKEIVFSVQLVFVFVSLGKILLLNSFFDLSASGKYYNLCADRVHLASNTLRWSKMTDDFPDAVIIGYCALANKGGHANADFSYFYNLHKILVIWLVESHSYLNYLWHQITKHPIALHLGWQECKNYLLLPSGFTFTLECLVYFQYNFWSFALRTRLISKEYVQNS